MYISGGVALLCFSGVVIDSAYDHGGVSRKWKRVPLGYLFCISKFSIKTRVVLFYSSLFVSIFYFPYFLVI